VTKHSRAFELMCCDVGGAVAAVGRIFARRDQHDGVERQPVRLARALRPRRRIPRLRWNHDWDFALRALWLDEPVFVDEPLYAYRLHAHNTIEESSERSRDEMAASRGIYLEHAMSERATLAESRSRPDRRPGDARSSTRCSSRDRRRRRPAMLRDVASSKLARARRASPAASA
jgi:hypothetical protein